MVPKKKKKFLNIPLLKGGNPDFRKFVEANLKYPQQALSKKIEGIVHLTYDVDDSGNVFNEKIVKGIGFGCDEEALRLIRLLQFSKVNNQGVRLHINQKAKIKFQLPKKDIEDTSITYHYVEKKEELQTKYNYTISF